MTKDQIRANLQAMDDDALWEALCANTPGDMDASIMTTEELIEYGVNHWQEDEGQRRATAQEINAARNVHAGTDLNIDEGAKVAECSEGMWVQAWVWVSAADIAASPHD